MRTTISEAIQHQTLRVAKLKKVKVIDMSLIQLDDVIGFSLDTASLQSGRKSIGYVKN